MGDTTRPGDPAGDQTAELIAVRNAAEAQTAEESWPGASARTNQSVEVQELHVRETQREPSINGATTTPETETVEEEGQRLLRRFSLFREGNQILSQMFMQSHGSKFIYHTAASLGGSSWKEGGTRTLRNGSVINFTAGELTSEWDVFAIAENGEIRVLKVISGFTNELHRVGDWKGASFVQRAAGVAGSWEENDFIFSSEEQRLIIQACMAIAARLQPSRESVLNEIIGMACGGAGVSNLASQEGAARLLGGLAGLLPGVGVRNRQGWLDLMRNALIVAESTPAQIPSVTRSEPPVTSGTSDLYKRVAAPSDLPSMHDTETAERTLNARLGEVVSKDDQSVLLAVLQSRGTAQRRASELFLRRIKQEGQRLGNSLDNNEEILGRVVGGRAGIKGVIALAEAVSGVSMESDNATWLLHSVPALADCMRGIIWRGAVEPRYVSDLLLHFTKEHMGVVDDQTLVLLSLDIVAEIFKGDRTRIEGATDSEVDSIVQKHVVLLSKHAFGNRLPPHLKGFLKTLEKKRPAASTLPAKKTFSEDDCYWCVGYHKGTCGPNEDTDPAGFAAFVCPRGKDHKRVPCKLKHEKGEVCQRGVMCHFYHGYGNP